MRKAREQAFRNAARLMAETGCGAVKLEGGAEHGGDDRASSSRAAFR